MICDIEIDKIKPNSIIVVDENCKGVCITKDELLKEVTKEIEALKITGEKLEQAFNRFKVDEKQENNDFRNAIYKFIKILKGDLNDEKEN